MTNDNSKKIIDEIRDGSLTRLDGVMSTQTMELIEVFQTFGVDMTSFWALTPQDWSCPVCERHKIHIARPNRNNDLMCRLVEHHDHAQELLKQQFETASIALEVIVANQRAEEFAKRSSKMISAFDNTVICDDCNVADVKAKKVSGADYWFSFSPEELKKIVLPENNEPHSIDEDQAKSIWRNSKSTFELRLKIAKRIAEIAATDTHWFQTGNINYDPSIIMRRASDVIRTFGGAYGLIDLLTGSKRQQRVEDPSNWRKKQHMPAKKKPTLKEIEHCAKVKSEKHWNLVDEDWVCEGCGRGKIHIVRKSKENKWFFSLSPRWYWSRSEVGNKSYHTLCNDCGLVAEGLAKEARLLSNKSEGRLSFLVEVNQISRVVIPKAHTRHNIDNGKAEHIVNEIVNRLEQLSE
ncbi:hypothetical protein CWC33_12335 [Idiomarina sp. X4]|uniref:hypothetical protein n=1 Tax=Idiomarina sp. X4 TaxID=2055892 RepID=UPI000C28B700|nr:hypothetical protein [Idiomarina sp. X4]ATZ74437.1 hypothetical protein CWC33_12335 [Idiomarina sp. X4]